MAHPDARAPLLAWWKAALAADWTNLAAVRRTYPHADAVTLPGGLPLTVFNVGGNKYRLVVRIVYEYRRVYIRRVMTHAQYSGNRWKAEL